MVRGAEGAVRDQACVGVEHAGDGVDLRGLERFLKRSGGRMEGRRLASMVLPEPGGPIIRRLWPPAAATSRARLATCWPRTSSKSAVKCWQRASRALAVDAQRLGEDGAEVGGVEQLADFEQRVDRKDVDAFDDGGLGGVGGGDDEVRDAGGAGGDGDGQHPWTARSAAVEAEFADEEEVETSLMAQAAVRAEEADGDGQVEAGAFLLEVGGCEVDGDAANTKTNSFKDVNCTT